MIRYLPILQNDLPFLTEEDLTLPVRESKVDSLDLVVARVAIENFFGFGVEDRQWYGFQSLFEALQFFHEQKPTEVPAIGDYSNSVEHYEQVEIRMPQMANSALSESWLLKYLGDFHWQLISKLFNTKSSDFQNEEGQRLYATFVRITYDVSPLNQFKENSSIAFSGEITSLNADTFASEVRGVNGENEISATMMTAFSVRLQDNTVMSKSVPRQTALSTRKLHSNSKFLNEYRLLRKNLLDVLETRHHIFPVADNLVLSTDYTINPFYDINGVGLLYFAAHPIIADTCIYLNGEPIDIASSTTIFRDVFYLANCNASDSLRITVNAIERKDDKVFLVKTLMRKSDNRPIAKIFTIKQLTCS